MLKKISKFAKIYQKIALCYKAMQQSQNNEIKKIWFAKISELKAKSLDMTIQRKGTKRSKNYER